ncbi:ferrous iron transport protein A [Candidatus Woesearchaeota archaeon]|nr:ferrous iron transport protein A [Candidatus Woesearchaeota archaeon]
MEMPLSQLGKGRSAVIKKIIGGSGFKRKISSLGLRIGKKVMIMSSQPFRGPLVVKVDCIGIAIGRGMANKIIVGAR